MPTARQIEEIFFLERGFYLHRSTAQSIAHFLPIYYKLLQSHGVYLCDVEYTDLSPTGQHKLLTEAHDMWVKNPENKELSEHYLREIQAYKFVKEQILENESLKESLEELKGIIRTLQGPV